MSLTFTPKDPDEVLDYRVNWTARLEGDTIDTSTFSLVTAAGLTIDSESNTTTSATVVLSGGTAGAVATLLNRITTAGGRTMDEDITLAIDSGLVVEDGTGLAGADTFASVVDAASYCAARGLSWSGTNAAQEQALRRGFDWLNQKAYKGVRTSRRDQAGCFPRTGCDDGEGDEIASDEVPVEIVHANIELAVYELANPGGLAPAVTLTDRVKSERVGPLAVEYASAAMTPDAARPVLTRVTDLIGGLLSSRSNSLVGTVTRG